MKKGLHGLDLYYLLKELGILKNAKLAKIFQLDKKDFLFEFYKTGRGAQLLRVKLPSFIFLSSKKESSLQVPQFCKQLRKALQGDFLTDILQHNLDRILILTFKSGHKVILELFSKGNLILCDSKLDILLPLSSQRWKDRTIKKGERYIFPPSENLFDYSLRKFSDKLQNSSKQNVVKALATDFSLGGLYAEYVCSSAGVDKSLSQKELSASQISALHKSVLSLQRKKLSPNIIVEGDTVDVLPFDFGMSSRKVDSFSKGIEMVSLSAKKASPYDNKIAELKKIIAQLDENMSELHEDYDSSSKKGELLYENYETVSSILQHLAEKDVPLRELKKKLKTHPILKDIIPSKQKVILELR